MLTHFRFTLTPPYIEHMMSVKNETEIDGMRKAYLRDGVSFVCSSHLSNSSGINPSFPGEISSMAGD